jgi:hypothetical protein
MPQAIVQGIGAVGASVYLPHEREPEARGGGSASPRASTRAKPATAYGVVEAVVQRRAKVRAHFEVDGGAAVGCVEKGQVVAVVDSAVARDGTPRSAVEAPGIRGWVTSDLLGPRRKAKAPAGAWVDEPHRPPSQLRRNVSLQRPKIHVAI